MDIQELDYQDEENKRKGIIGSGIFHALCFLFLLVSFIHVPNPPPTQEGVLISFGNPDEGSPSKLLAMADTEPEAIPEETEDAEAVDEPEETEPEVEPDPTPTKKSPTKKQPKVIETDDPKALALKKAETEKKKKRDAEKKKKRDEEKKKKSKADKAAKKKKDAESKAKKEKAAKEKAAKDAAAKAAQEAAEKAAASKKKFGDMFGDGGGDNDKPGQQGSQDGDPNANNLDGLSTGTGKIGGGLGSRGGKGPALKDDSQATGVVVIKVCIDANGNVISSTFTQAGSSTSNAQLIALATKNAKSYNFKKGSADKQCGTITYDFKVK